jgi:hypothetical protein
MPSKRRVPQAGKPTSGPPGASHVRNGCVECETSASVLLLRRFPFADAGARENIRHAVVAFRAGVLV